MAIQRRDFVNGLAASVALSTLASPGRAAAKALLPQAASSAPYPPALTGLRGTSDDARNVGHALSWRREDFAMPAEQVDETYDLVVVGAGISGLAAALFFRQQAGPDAKILILDNHDDFGGHSKRNEFEVDGRKLISYGGVQNLLSPNAMYTGPSATFLKLLGIDPDAVDKAFDRGFYAKHGLTAGIYFDAGNFGDRAGLRRNPFYNLSVSFRNTVLLARDDKAAAAAAIDSFPIADQAKRDLKAIVANEVNHYASLSNDEWLATLSAMSYRDYLRQHYPLHDDAWLALRGQTIRWVYDMDWDRQTALLAMVFYMPGFGIDLHKLEREQPAYFGGQSEPYTHHFPDGGATLTRNAVRLLIPSVTPAGSWEELVTAPFDYGQLDRPEHNARVRLNQTAVQVRNTGDGRFVDVAYVDNRTGQASRVRAKHTIMACWNGILPYICPEMPEAQKQALGYAQKVPATYVQIALRNWRAIAASGYGTVHHTDGFFSDTTLDFPISLGGYRYSAAPDQPIVLTGFHANNKVDDPSFSNREMYVTSRHKLMHMKFREFERGALEHLDEVYGPSGFDAKRDVAAITVNRWPHGYAYDYNPLFDDPSYSMFDGPHIAGRQRIGRISIANSDAEANPLITGAVDAAARAVGEQVGG